jgi:chromosome partitioning protein
MMYDIAVKWYYRKTVTEGVTHPLEIIAIASQKGGVGKTPATVNLAFALARLRYRVLMVDTDPQASLTEYLLAQETYEQETTVYNAIMDIEPIAPIEIRENIHLLNAHDELFEAEFRLPSMPNPDGRLRAVLDMYNYDFCVIDTPPNLGLLTRNALGAASQVLIPVKTELTAQRTLKRFYSTLDDIRKSGLNRKIAVWWILPTLYDSRKAHHREILQSINLEYGSQVYQEPAKETTKYNDATTLKTDTNDLDHLLGNYWNRLAATHPGIREESING